jgi:hypothetical protein
LCTMGQCQKHLGQWVQFQTPWGRHRGVIEAVNPRGVLIRVPRQYVPARLANHAQSPDQSDEQKLDMALTQWGYGGGWGGGPGYGGAPAWNGGYGRPGYGGWWWGGWWWWWLAFAWIFWLAWLW